MQLQQATEAIHQAGNILIVSHVNPDGDAVGSMLGLANALRHLNKDVTTAIDDGAPDYLKFLPGAEHISPDLTNHTTQWDVMISTDASDEERSGAVGTHGRANSTTVINIDHHITNTFFGDIHLVAPDAVSAAEVVFTWLEHMQIPLTHDIALPLLTGMVTDTMGFRTSSVNARTFQILQSLMSVGLDLHNVIARTLGSMTLPEFKLWQRILPQAKLDGAVMYATITPGDIEAVGLPEITDAGLVSRLVEVEEVRVAVIFKVISDEEVRLTMRAKLGYDVARVALTLGGGGHKQAAGATVQGTLEQVMTRVLPMLQQSAQA